MRKNKLLSVLLTLAMVITSISIPSAAFAGTGGIVQTINSKNVGETVQFGYYPQTEIVASASDCGVYNKFGSASGTDYIVDENLYNQLSNSTSWDSNNDLTIGSTKYHRLAKEALTEPYNSTYRSNNPNNYYQWGSVDYRYFRYDNISWKILEKNEKDNTALLISSISLDDKSYGGQTWSGSSVRKWLNDSFANAAFSSEDMASIVLSSNTDMNTQEYVFCLSKSEANNASYFSDNNACKCTSSTYAKAMGTYVDSNNCSSWWLRSNDTNPDYVNIDGGFSGASSNVTCVRPAIRINLHEHNMVYGTGTNVTEGDSLTASCNGAGTCQYGIKSTSAKLILNVATSTDYTGDPVVVTLTNLARWNEYGLATPTMIKYQTKNSDGSWDTEHQTKEAPTEVGTYRAVVSLDGQSDKVAYKEFTINKAKVNLPKANAVEYNGKEQTGVTLPENAVYTLTGNTGTAIGKHVATATLITPTNYEWNIATPSSEPQAIEWTMAKTSQHISFDTAKVSKTYGDGNFELIVKGANTKPYYTSSNSRVAVVDPQSGTVKIKNVGTTVITATAPSDDTFGLASTSYTLTVSPKTVTVKANDQTSYVGEELSPLTYTADELIGSDCFTGVLSTTASKNVAGEYKITQGSLAINDGNNGANYVIKFQDGNYSVADSDVEAGLIVKGTVYNKKSIRLTWTESEDQATYKVFIAKCSSNKWNCVKTTTTATAYNKKNLKAKTNYKIFVASYNNDGELIEMSPIIHVATAGSKYANATKVTSSLSETELSTGDTAVITAKVAKKSSKKALLWKNHAAKIRYYSADNDVATVTADGTVTATGRGIVNIYAVAPSGAYAVTTVKVINA